jgi:methionyl-tRNA synthetase
MIFKNLDGVLPEAGQADEDIALLGQVEQACAVLTEEFQRFAFSAGLEAWMAAVFACNQYVDSAAPWALRKTDPQRMADVLGTLVVAIRALAVAVAPVVPASADKLLTLIDSGQGGVPIAQPQPIFPRLELAEDEAA